MLRPNTPEPPSPEVPGEWWDVAGRAENAETVLVVGASDRGKSTFVRWLVGILSSRKSVVGWLDGDVGQSTLAVPTLQSLALVTRACRVPPQPIAAHFVGATTPRAHMLPVLVGIRKLRDLASSREAEAVVVDTTGLVAVEAGGGALKRWKTEILQPDLIVALERKEELNHLLQPMRREGRWEVCSLTPATAARIRDREERIRRRTERFRRYFESAVEVRLPDTCAVVESGEPSRGQLAALQDRDGFCLALARVEEAGSPPYRLRTPLGSLDEVTGLWIGEPKLDDTFAEIDHENGPFKRLTVAR